MIRKRVFSFRLLWTLGSDLWPWVWPCILEEEGGCPLTNWFNTTFFFLLEVMNSQTWSQVSCSGAVFIYTKQMCPGRRQRQMWDAFKDPKCFKMAESQQISETDLLLRNINCHTLISNQYFLLLLSVKWQKRLNLKWTFLFFLFSPTMSLEKETALLHPARSLGDELLCNSYRSNKEMENFTSTRVKPCFFCCCCFFYFRKPK